MRDSPLAAIAIAVLLGAGGQVLASMIRLPAIIFLLILGLAAGPYGIGLVRPECLGASLPVVTSAFIAIILFEGGLTLRPSLLRQAMAPVRRLITVGAAATLVGGALLGRLVVGLPWPLAFVFASLVVVTGPTVIAPILRRVRLRPQLHAVLKAESILIDAVGVIVAVVVLQYVVGLHNGAASWLEALGGFFGRAAVGAAVGGAAGLAAAALARLRLFHKRDNGHLINLGGVGIALGVYAAAEFCRSESGVLAVIVAGLILGAARLPFREELEKFKEDLTTLGVSVLFILLAANLKLEMLYGAGWPEAALVAGLMFLVRPASVFLSTAGTSLLWREKAYLSLMAPRGIVAAAMASYFTTQLRAHGVAGADRIEALVFLTIAATVCVQGGWAALLARLLRVRAGRAQGVVLVGVNESSLAAAEVLRANGRPVLFVDNNPTRCASAAARRFPVHQGDALSEETYEAMDLSLAGVFLAMTSNDAVNARACDAAGKWFGQNVLQVVRDSRGRSLQACARAGAGLAAPTRRSHREIARLVRAARVPATGQAA